MTKKSTSAESKRRTEIKDLSKSEQELTKEEQKKIKGGVIRSVGNRDDGGTNVIGGGDITGQQS